MSADMKLRPALWGATAVLWSTAPLPLFCLGMGLLLRRAGEDMLSVYCAWKKLAGTIARTRRMMKENGDG